MSSCPILLADLNDREGDADLTARYDALLACLRSNGALLTTKAEHLGTSSVMLASTPFGSWERQALEKLYPSVSRLAWLDVLAQVNQARAIRMAPANLSPRSSKCFCWDA